MAYWQNRPRSSNQGRARRKGQEEKTAGLGWLLALGAIGLFFWSKSEKESDARRQAEQREAEAKQRAEAERREAEAARREAARANERTQQAQRDLKSAQAEVAQQKQQMEATSKQSATEDRTKSQAEMPGQTGTDAAMNGAPKAKA